MEIFYHSKFIKIFKKLNKELQLLILERENIFKINIYDLRLKTHKLHGHFIGYLSFSINYKYRVIFNFEENGKDVKFYIIGTHDIYE